MGIHAPDIEDAFFVAWIAMADHCNLDPEHALAVSFSESACLAKAHNPNGNASGLIQFMPQTLLGLGWSKGPDAFRALSATEQVEFVGKYYKPYEHLVLDSAARIYLATFLPALLEQRGSHESAFVLCGAQGPLAWAYSANKVFDRDNKGHITLGDLGAAVVRNCHGLRWDELTERLRIAQIPPDTPTEPVEVPSVPPRPYTEIVEGVLDANEDARRKDREPE